MATVVAPEGVAGVRLDPGDRPCADGRRCAHFATDETAHAGQPERQRKGRQMARSRKGFAEGEHARIIQIRAVLGYS